MPAGTILITGANGSVAAQTVRYLLSRDPEGTTTTTLLLTVRNTSDADVNTKRLREIVSQYPASAQSPQSSQSPQSPESPQCRESSARVIIKRLDLASLKDVHEFATSVAAEIARRDLPPLRGIVCNAFHWNLVGDGNGEGDGESTQDGLERTMQVNLVAHAALVLRLLGSFGSFGERIREGEVDSEGEDEGAGRIVLFTSDCHETGQNSLEVYPPGIPEDLEDLVRGRGRGRGKRRDDGNAGDHGDDDAEMVDREEDKDKRGHGFQRYANSKLAILMWTYALNRYLEKVSVIQVFLADFSLLFPPSFHILLRSYKRTTISLTDGLSHLGRTVQQNLSSSYRPRDHR